MFVCLHDLSSLLSGPERQLQQFRSTHATSRSRPGLAAHRRRGKTLRHNARSVAPADTHTASPSRPVCFGPASSQQAPGRDRSRSPHTWEPELPRTSVIEHLPWYRELEYFCQNTLPYLPGGGARCEIPTLLIRWTHKDVDSRAAFAHNEHKGQSLYKLIDHLWRREKTANDCEPIICVRHDGKIYALGGDLPPAS